MTPFTRLPDEEMEAALGYPDMRGPWREGDEFHPGIRRLVVALQAAYAEIDRLNEKGEVLHAELRAQISADANRRYCLNPKDGPES